MAGKALIPGSIEFGLEKLALAFRAELNGCAADTGSSDFCMPRALPKIDDPIRSDKTRTHSPAQPQPQIALKFFLVLPKCCCHSSLQDGNNSCISLLQFVYCSHNRASLKLATAPIQRHATQCFVQPVASSATQRDNVWKLHLDPMPFCAAVAMVKCLTSRMLRHHANHVTTQPLFARLVLTRQRRVKSRKRCAQHALGVIFVLLAVPVQIHATSATTHQWKERHLLQHAHHAQRVLSVPQQGHIHPRSAILDILMIKLV